jgi:DNA-binding NarL/FixJ family response regulator
MRVAIVEDSSLMQERLRRTLTAIPGVKIVGFAANVEAANQLIESTRPDLVVLDVELQDGQTSMGVLRFLTRTHPSIDAIVLSNFTWGSMRAGFLAEGAKAYFDKSLEFSKARDWIAERRAGPDSKVLDTP